MKKFGLGIIVTGLLCVSINSRADVADTIKATLNDVSVIDLPVKAARLVTEAAPADQEKVAIAVVKAAIAAYPTAAAAVVGAISRAAPSTAPAITALAVALQPKMRDAIVKAATSAAPTYITQIAQAVNAQDNVGILAAKTRPPFVPGGGTPGEVNRSQTVVVQPGQGRVYSKP